MPKANRQPEEALREKAVSGAKWAAMANVATFVFGFGKNIILARLLTPRDFGLAGMLWAVLGLAQLLPDLGMSGVLLFRQQAAKREISSVFWFTAFVSIGLSAVLLTATPLLVWFNKEPMLADLAPWAVAGFFLNSLGTPLRTLSQKDMLFSGLAWAEVAGGAVALVSSVMVAMAGHEVYALLVGGLAAAGVKLAVVSFILREKWPIVFHFRWSDIRTMTGFGLYQLGDRVANYLWSNLDYLLVGRMLGAGPLGYYQMAYETAVRPLAVVNPIFNSVAYPLFARKQHDLEAMRRGYLDMIGLLAALVLPLLAGLAVAAELILEAVFGAKWTPAAPALRILCLVGALRCLQNPIGALVIARGMPRVGLIYNSALLILNLVCFPIALAYGIEPLCWAAVITMAFSMVVLWKPVYSDTIALPAVAWLRRVRTPALLSGLMALAVWLLIQGLPSEWMGPLKLALAIPAGVIIYVAAYWRADSAFVHTVVAMMKKRG